MPELFRNSRVPFEVVFQDEHVLVASKPAGVVTQPGKGHEDDTLLNGIASLVGDELDALGEARDFGLVHRLDRDTSGLVAVALTEQGYDHIRQAFESRAVGKTYLAATRGIPHPADGTCDAKLQETRRDGMKLSLVRATGQYALTHYRTLNATRQHALLACTIETGRLHQIRVHLRHLGCPVVGDKLYTPVGLRPRGPSLISPARRPAALKTAQQRMRAALPSPAALEMGLALMLHAYELTLPHPARPDPLTCVAPPPAKFLDGLRQLGLRWTGVPGRAAGDATGKNP